MDAHFRGVDAPAENARGQRGDILLQFDQTADLRLQRGRQGAQFTAQTGEHAARQSSDGLLQRTLVEHRERFGGHGGNPARGRTREREVQFARALSKQLRPTRVNAANQFLDRGRSGQEIVFQQPRRGGRHRLGERCAV